METTNTPVAPTPATPTRILVVDDDRDVCELVKDVFDAIPDVSVTACTDPRDALEHIQYRPVDLVLTDIFMGRYSGLDVLVAVKESHPDAVVIMMTGQPSVENALAAMRRGAYDYILKPFDIHSLRRTVERGIERRRLWLENAHLSELVSLYRLSHAASSKADLSDVMQLAVNAVRAEFQPEFVALFLAATDGTAEAVTSAGEPIGPNAEAFFRADDAQSREALGTGEPVVALVSSPAWNTGATCAQDLKGARIAYPVCVGERVAGLINLQCPPRPEPVNPGDLKTLAILAGQVGGALENRRLLERLQSAYIDMVHALASALDARDRSTRDHTNRVCHLAEAIAREMGWSDDRLPELWLGCVLHDIGKIGVPDTILQKPGTLTDEEYELMKTHTIRGARMVESIPYLQAAVPYILHHHERYDGNGYPHGLGGEAIPIEARLLAVVDTFDAIISDRPYRKGRSAAVALAEIQACSGSQFDPEVVEAFVRAWGSGAIDRRLLATEPSAKARFIPEFRIQLT